MSRATLDDRISYCRRELATLEAIQTNCHSCAKKSYESSFCRQFGHIDGGIMNRTDCPFWEFEAIPF